MKNQVAGFNRFHAGVMGMNPAPSLCQLTPNQTRLDLYRVNSEVNNLKPFACLAFPSTMYLKTAQKQDILGDELVTSFSFPGRCSVTFSTSTRDHTYDRIAIEEGVDNFSLTV